MRSTDKLLVGIVVGAVLLVAAAVAVTLLRPEPTYQAEDTPEGVVHNYLLALQREDYRKAYSYLSAAIPGYPRSLQAFEANVQANSYAFRLGNTPRTLQVLSSSIEGDKAVVIVQETSFNQGGLFDSGQSTRTFEMDLSKDLFGDTWRLRKGNAYWASCWNRQAGCG